ncbi:LysR substrate-binding domain-containing protein [Halomonas sp.]|uniref:LysR substrate-binding domain-containing protein n=1 Tax=Halomonas sp. TaxID=1486246 RepID=UPI002580658B|nr:LysR substrate-binding domain-containing protein [Halomonas sp.]|tara:strand:+ start:2393 stop:3331 length:939 start_codon:yes stop_codon:yes gene_type:complete
MNPNPASMKSLIAFETTARLGSMTAAAEAERTTQPTISQRIRGLEEYLGLVLFDRHGGRLSLTVEGERFYREMAPSLTTLRDTCDRFVRHGQGPAPTVVIAADAGFTHLWLLPRLPALKRAFPDFSFHLMPIDRSDDPQLLAADIAIRFGPYLPQEEGQLVAREAVFPVCSPDYAQAHGLSGPLSAQDLSRLSLLHQDIRNPRWLDWAQWCRHAGLTPPPAEDIFAYHNYALLLNAALAHQGVALGWSNLVEEYLVTGQLTALGPQVTREDYGYWLSVKHQRSAVTEPVKNWLLDAVHRGEGAASGDPGRLR